MTLVWIAKVETGISELAITEKENIETTVHWCVSHATLHQFIYWLTPLWQVPFKGNFESFINGISKWEILTNLIAEIQLLHKAKFTNQFLLLGIFKDSEHSINHIYAKLVAKGLRWQPEPGLGKKMSFLIIFFKTFIPPYAKKILT